MRAIGVSEFLARSFDCYNFEGPWLDSFAEPEKNFRMLVYGHSGNGKTEFCIQLAKYMARYTKVYYNSFEQGVSKSLQDALRRNNMQEVTGKVIFGDRETFEEMLERLGARNAPQVVFIDSRDFINLTQAQFKRLIELHPRKAFIVVAWEAGGRPKGEHAKSIEYICDIKVRVHQFKAYPRCRYGGNMPFVIWDRKQTGKKEGEQSTLF